MKACPRGMSLFIKIKNHSMKTNLFTIFAFAMIIAIPTQAQTAREDIREIPRRAGSNYLAYLDQLRNDDAKADKAWNEAAESDLELYNEDN